MSLVLHIRRQGHLQRTHIGDTADSLGAVPQVGNTFEDYAGQDRHYPYSDEQLHQGNRPITEP